MKKGILSLFMALVMVMGMLPASTLSAAAADTAITSTSISITSGNTYTIDNATQFGYFRDIVNSGNNCTGATIKLTNSFGSLGAWTPIGNFAGIFDGGGNIINGMTINYTATQGNETKHLGLFGVIQSGGTVKNLTVSLSNVTYNGPSSYSGNSFYVGGIAGINRGRIENCNTKVTIIAADGTNLVDLLVGGIAGANYGTITGCSNDGTITVNSAAVSSSFGIGGICGISSYGYYNNYSVLNCYNTGLIGSNTANAYIGGIVGYGNSSIIENCYNTGTIMGTTVHKAGIASFRPPSGGYTGAKVLNCYNGNSEFPIFANATDVATVTNSYQYTGPNFVSYTNSSDTQNADTLLATLNTWVEAKTADGKYMTWKSGSPGPVFDQSWALQSYTISFDSAGGSIVDSITQDFGTTVTSPANPTREGYTFTGWSPTVPETMPATNTNLVAQWSINSYTISFNSAGGSAVSSILQNFGTNVVAPTAPTKSGYTFTGWSPTVPETMPATDRTLVAQWSINSYTISFNSAGGSAVASISQAFGTTVTAPTAPARAGYTFAGWSPTVPETMPATDRTLVAQWTINQYTITYNSNGGSAVDSIVQNYGTTVTRPTDPTRTGYTFTDWTPNIVSVIGDATYTANWKANTPSALAITIVTGRTDTTLTIKTEEGYEYSVDGVWHSGTGSYTFTGLTAGTPYGLVCRKAEVTSGFTSAASEPSPALSVKTKYAAPAAPSVNVVAVEANRILLTAVDGAEYSKDNGVTWQNDNSFSGLAPATQYTFAIRVKETDSTVSGLIASKTQYTAATTPDVGVGYSVDYSTEKITITTGYDLSTDPNFFSGTLIVSGSTITPGATYYVRVAESGGVPASDRVQFSLSPRPAAPSEIVISKTADSITISSTIGQEYKIGTGEWQGSASFTGLSTNTGYIVYTRVKATGSTFASVDYLMSVTTKSVGSVTIPIQAAVTYDPAKTLGDIALSANWAWGAPATVPAVENSGYRAVYTPADTDTVDYSEITGYTVDGSGIVTITETISLTVNRATPTAADFTYVQPMNLVYNGTAKSASVNANNPNSGMGTFTVKYYQDGAETTPINAGIYTVKIDIAQGDNYAAAIDVTGSTDSAWTFTIEKVAQAPISITSTPASITYGDTFTLTTTGGSGTGSVTWDVTAGDSATVDAAGNVAITGIGATTITATKAADGNYIADVTGTYIFTPEKLQLAVDSPAADGGWTKTYDGSIAFDTAITVGGIINRVGADDVSVSAISATFDTANVGTGNKVLTIAYAIDGEDSENYLNAASTVINTASITAAIPTVALVNKNAVVKGTIIDIAAAKVTGIPAENDITASYGGIISYNYYTKDTCTKEDMTTAEKSGAEAIGGAPKNAGTYYVKAKIPANGNYAEAESNLVTLTIYRPSSGLDKAAIVIVDGKVVDMATSEAKGNITTVVVDQNKMTEQLNSAKDSVVISFTSETNIASVQLVLQNVESMAERGVSLTIIVGNVSYNIPSGAIDTAAALKTLGAMDSSKVPFNITISKLSNSSVTLQKGMLMVPPVEFSITATYNGKSVSVEEFGSYVQRVIEIPDKIDPENITTAVVVKADGTQRHVPTEVYTENGKWYARINSMTNSIYALIQNNVNFIDTKSKWYDESVTEMASREIISGIGKNMFAGERAITRAEFSAILIRGLGLPDKSLAAETFDDVSANKWYFGAVGTAYEYGLVTGKGQGKFDPMGNITRQEAMTMIARAAKLAGYEGKIDNISKFSDVTQIKDWALDAVKFNVGSGLIVGNNGQLRPQDEISRAETATVVLRLLRKSELIDVRN